MVKNDVKGYMEFSRISALLPWFCFGQPRFKCTKCCLKWHLHMHGEKLVSSFEGKDNMKHKYLHRNWFNKKQQINTEFSRRYKRTENRRK